jgi:hypothetical protein
MNSQSNMFQFPKVINLTVIETVLKKTYNRDSINRPLYRQQNKLNKNIIQYLNKDINLQRIKRFINRVERVLQVNLPLLIINRFQMREDQEESPKINKINISKVNHQLKK